MAPSYDSPSLALLLARLPDQVPLGRVERLWIFPPRLLGEVESGLLVLSLLPENGVDAGQREVVTVQYEARSGKAGPAVTPVLTGRGWAPSERVPQVIAGVVRRLGGGEEEPVSETIGGDLERYQRLLERLGVAEAS